MRRSDWLEWAARHERALLLAGIVVIVLVMGFMDGILGID